MTGQCIQQDAIWYQWFKQRLILSVSEPSISQRSQIKEDTVEPSVLARELNLKAYAAITWHKPNSTITVARQNVLRRYWQCQWGRLREPTRRIQLFCNQDAVDHIRHVAVADLVPSQVDKPKRHRSACEIYAWNCYSLFKCVHDNMISSSNASYNVVLCHCLKPIAFLISLADKQPYHQQILLLFYYKP